MGLFDGGWFEFSDGRRPAAAGETKDVMTEEDAVLAQLRRRLLEAFAPEDAEREVAVCG